MDGYEEWKVKLYSIMAASTETAVRSCSSAVDSEGKFLGGEGRRSGLGVSLVFFNLSSQLSTDISPPVTRRQRQVQSQRAFPGPQSLQPQASSLLSLSPHPHVIHAR